MDIWDKERRSRCMASIHSKDTKPELTVRRYLYSHGYRFRKNVRRLPGSPDIVLRKYGIVIFVHGCFWHGHETHIHIPKSNKEYWAAKIARNRRRDEECKEKLRQMGWSVITVWECQLTPRLRVRTLAEIERLINHNFLRRYQNKPPTDHDANSASASILPYDTFKETTTPIAAESHEDYAAD